MLLKTLVGLVRAVLWLTARLDIKNIHRIPSSGGAVVVTNHLGRLDAILGVMVAVMAGRDDLILMVAEKYQGHPLWGRMGDRLNVIWLNRFETDFGALRQVYQRLSKGGLLGIAPEGTRSQTEMLALGKPGSAYLAAKAGVPVVPVGLMGTEDRVVKERLRRFRRLDINLRFGEPFILPPLPRKDRDAFLEAQTDEIMCRIAALVTPEYRGAYADHPRLQELLQAQES